MCIFDIDKNIESIDENIREHKIKQLKSNPYIKFINVIDDLKYINDSYDGDMVYVIGSDEVYIYMNEWIKISSYYGNI